jgi:hypothetical protein
MVAELWYVAVGLYRCANGLALTVTAVPMIDVKVSGLSGGRRRQRASVSPLRIEALGGRGTGGGWRRYKVEEVPPQPQAVD